MGFFPATVAAYLADQTVRMVRLVELEFADAPGRYWETGTGPLVTLDGKTWQGTGSLVEISEIQIPIGDAAPQVSLSLSGVDPGLLPDVTAAETKVKGRPGTIYLQFFDEDWKPLDEPYAVFPGIMDVMSFQAAAGSATISLTLEGLFTRRGVPAWGYLSNISQQRLFPGDRGLEEVPSMREAQPYWPVF